ncbi:MAG: DeoR/GlpR family DNA-binding transcription regulator [Mycobacteriales bacterium]
MFAAERRQAILDLVRANGAVSLRSLAEQVHTSEVTVRRDLHALEDEGLLGRRHGGAVAVGAFAHEPTYAEKSHLASEEKTAIAEYAAELVADGDAIVIGAGTTTQALARRLVRRRDLTVVTNSLLVAQSLARAQGVDVVMTGGTLRGAIFALVGSEAEKSLSALRTARSFISGNGLTAERGLSTPNTAVAGVDRAIVGAAGEVVVLADHTKVGVDTMVQTVQAERIDRLVTDQGAAPAELERLRDRGIEVTVVMTAAAAAASGRSTAASAARSKRASRRSAG